MKVNTQRAAKLCSLAVALCAGTAQAGIITYTDQAAFLSHLGPGYFLDTFTGVTNGGIQGDANTRSGNGFSVTYTAPPGGLFSIDGGMSTMDIVDNLVATLGSGIYAAGGYFYLTDIDGIFQTYPGNSVSAFASNGVDPNSTLSVSVNSATNFFGWISDTPLTSVTVNSGGTTPSSHWNTLDNFIVGVAAVPEPGSLALLALGGFGLIRRLKSRQTR